MRGVSLKTNDWVKGTPINYCFIKIIIFKFLGLKTAKEKNETMWQVYF